MSTEIEEKVTKTILNRMVATLPGLQTAVAALTPATDETSIQTRQALERCIAWIKFFKADMQTGLPEPVPETILTKKQLYEYLWRGVVENGQMFGAPFGTAEAGAHKLDLKELHALTVVNVCGMETLFAEA